MNLKKYLKEIRQCRNQDRLLEELKIQDNYMVLLYGNPEDLFPKVTDAFRASPQKEGIRDEWCLDRDGLNNKTFNYKPGTAIVQVEKGSHAFFMRHTDRIDGADHSVWLSFHPYQGLSLEDSLPSTESDWLKMASAIAGFGEYVLRKKLAARFPAVNINHVPK